MSIEIVMPQMGESITEGTVSKWLKQVGERVEKDEAILEISTDKVDAEVPSPGAGILLEIRTQEGETVEVGTVVAVIGDSVGSRQSAVGGQPEAFSVESVTELASEGVHSVSATDDSNKTPHSALSTPHSVEIVMPQMGESITEGTVSKWLKAVGDTIEKDEALLEISTDKVDAEVPSPAGGTLLAINVQEGETVEVGAVLALVGSSVGGGQVAVGGQAAAPVASESAKPEPVVNQPSAGNGQPEKAAAAAATSHSALQTPHSIDELRRTKSSPLVRNIAREHGIDISRIPGSGLSGRVTRSDIMSFIETGAALRPQDLLVKGAPSMPAQAISTATRSRVEYAPPQAVASMEDRVEKMSVMRKKIAEHMTFSRQTSAHVTSVYEIDMTNVAKFRNAHQADFQAKFGTKLTFMPFIFQAVTAAIREHRIVNSQVDGDQIIYKGNINIGMAVALDWGLIVPVIRNADTLSLPQLATTANDLADRARTKRLMPDEVQGGTFTITNPGVFGGLFGTPIINQPQVAILCVGTIEKRPKVVTSPDGDDTLAIRQMAYFALTYDHRVVDGADAEKFLAYLKGYLESAPFTF